MRRLGVWFLSTCLLAACSYRVVSADDGDPASTIPWPIVPVVDDRQVMSASTVILTCPTLRERPEWWQINNYAIVEANSDGPITGKTSLAIDGKNLVITNVSFADEGTYSCSDTASPMATFNVKVHARPLPPVVWSLPPDAASIEKQKQKVTCESRYGRPVSAIRWQVDGADQEPSSAVVRQEANGTLTISSSIEVAVTNHVVHVVCIAEHAQLPAGDGPTKHEASINLRTYSLPKPTVAPAQLETLRAGQTIVVDCRIPDTNEAARPSLIWTLPDGFERQQVTIEGGFIVNRMTLIVAREMNDKVLTCRSELSHARSTPYELKMNILYAPSKPKLIVNLPGGDKTEQIGINDVTKVKVNCGEVDANPKASVRFLVNGAEVIANGAVPPMANSLMSLFPGRVPIQQIIDSIRSSGKRTTISCIAYNAIGSGASDTVALPVFAPPTLIRLGSISQTQELSSDLARGIVAFRSGVNVSFFCDMTGGELSEQAVAVWWLRCPRLTTPAEKANGEATEPTSTSATPESPEMLARLVQYVETNITTELAIDQVDRQHARAYMSRIVTKDDNECELKCQAVDPIAGDSIKNQQAVTLNIYYGPDDINVRFSQAAAYNDGEKVQAICEIGASKPEPTVAWSILTADGIETATSLPEGRAAVDCSSGLVSTCNASIEFVARADLNGSIVRCTATNPKLGVAVANDRRLEVLYKPRSANPSRCLSKFVLDFNERRNLSAHCLFEANPQIDSQQTQIWLVSVSNPDKKQQISPANGYPAQVAGGRPPWEIVQITRRLDRLEDLSFLDSYLVVTLQNRVGVSEFQIPTRINQNVLNISYVNPSTMQDEIWVGDSVDVTCTINSLYKVTRFAFVDTSIRQGDVVTQASNSGESRTITLNIPRISQDVELAGEVRRVACVAEFPAGTGVSNLVETKDIPIRRTIEGVSVFLNKPNEVGCRPTVGGGGKLLYRWWANGVEQDGGAATETSLIPAKERSRYECEITQMRGNQVLSVKRSDIFIVGQTPLSAIFYDLNVTALRVFSSAAEFFVARKLLPDVVVSPNLALPPAELRVSLQRDGNEQEYRSTVWVNGDWHVFNITDLLPGSTYNFTFWTKAPLSDKVPPHGHPNAEIWVMMSTAVISTNGAPIAVLRLRPEETAIIVILSAVSAALFLLFCNIFVCIKIRRKRQLMAEMARQANRRPSSCCFRDGVNKDDTAGTADTSPPASEAESAPTSVDMLTPNAASCSSSTSNGSAGALYVVGNENSTIKSKTSRRKSNDLVEVVQGFFRPDGLLLKPKYVAPNDVSDPNQAPSNSIYRELFGNDTTVSPIIPNLDFLDSSSHQAGLHQLSGTPMLLDDGSVYRAQSSAVYNIPMPFQYQHVGAGGDVMPVTATAVAPSSNMLPPSSEQLPLELQGDLV